MAEARVESIDALKTLKVSMVKFAEGANGALSDAESDVVLVLKRVSGGEAAFNFTSWTPEAVFKIKHITRLTLSPDGKQVAYVRTSFGHVDKWSVEFEQQLYVVGTDGKNQKLLTSLHGPCYGMQWSPDGQWLFVSEPGNLYRIRLADGQKKLVTMEGARNFRVSPDGQWVAYVGSDNFWPGGKKKDYYKYKYKYQT